jgi:hypothetical protein
VLFTYFLQPPSDKDKKVSTSNGDGDGEKEHDGDGADIYDELEQGYEDMEQEDEMGTYSNNVLNFVNEEDGYYAPARVSHALSCPPRAGARSSPANLRPPCPQPLLNGLFYCFFYFLCIVIFLYLYFYLYFVGYNLPAMLWFDLEEEIVVDSRPSASLWFFVVLAL